MLEHAETTKPCQFRASRLVHCDWKRAKTSFYVLQLTIGCDIKAVLCQLLMGVKGGFVGFVSSFVSSGGMLLLRLDVIKVDNAMNDKLLNFPL